MSPAGERSPLPTGGRGRRMARGRRGALPPPRVAATTVAMLAAGLPVGGCGDGPPDVEAPVALTLLASPEGALDLEETERLCLLVEDATGTPVSPAACLDDPTRGPDRGGEDDDGAGAAVLLVDPVDFGGPYRARVELLAGGRIVGRGRSFPFTTDGEGLPNPVRLLVGRVGHFADPLPGPPPWAGTARPLGIAAGGDGAIIGTSDGLVYRYRLGTQGRPRIDLVSAVPARAGARWAALPDGALVAVGGAAAGATLFDPDGGIASSTAGEASALLVPHRLGAAVVAADPTSLDAWVFGGSLPPEGLPSTAAARIRRGLDDRITVDVVSLLPRPRQDARAVLLPDVVDGGNPEPRTLLLGGNAPGEAIVFDPDRERYREASLLGPPGSDRGDPLPETAGIVDLADELVLVAGGRDAAGRALDSLRILQLGDDLGEPLAEPPLRRPRVQPGVVRFGEDAALVVGGLFENEVPSSTAEVVRIVRRFEVEVTPTPGVLPAPFPSPVAVRLADGTVLVVDAGAVALWFP